MATNSEEKSEEKLPVQAEYIQLKNNFSDRRALVSDGVGMAGNENIATYSSYPYNSATTSSNTPSTTNSTPLPSSLSSSSTTLTYKSLLAAMGSCFCRCVSKSTPQVVAQSSSSCWRRQTSDDQETDLMSNCSGDNRKNNFIYRIIRFKSKKRNQQFIEKFWEQNDIKTYQKLDNNKNKERVSDIQLQNLDVNKLLKNTSFAKESTMNYIAGINNCSSRASSSLDLEWEHEYSHVRHSTNQTQQHEILVPIHKPLKHTLTDNLLQANQYCTQDTNEDHPLHPPTDMSSIQNVPLERIHTPKSQLKHTACRQNSISRNSSHNSWSHISTPESLEWDIDEDQQRQLRTEDDNLDHETLKLLHEIEQLKNQVLNETGDGLLDANNDTSIQFNTTATTLHPLYDSGEIVNIS